MKKPAEPPSSSPSPQKRAPGALLMLLLLGVLSFFTFQQSSEVRGGKVSFSHQVEHLVNLDLTQGESSRKTAQNDHLVTFTGKFKESLTKEAQERYQFLQLLSQSHRLQGEKEELGQILSTVQKEAYLAGVAFLSWSGTPIPKEGIFLVSAQYDTPFRQNEIAIYPPLSYPKETLRVLKEEYAGLSHGLPSSVGVATLGEKLSALIAHYRSSAIGVGEEGLKERLRGAERILLSSSTLRAEEKIAAYGASLSALEGVTAELLKEREGTLLSGLRSVRGYLFHLNQYQGVSSLLEENQAKLAKAKHSVAGATWFFNNRELSTQALEKESSEAFQLWFSQAKKEFDLFPQNQGSSYRAPDQPRNLVLEKTFPNQELSPNYISYFILSVLPVILLFGVLYFLFAKQMKGAGSSGPFSFGKSPARLLNKSLHKVTFRDVAGVTEAKEELQEVVEFLKDPAKFTTLGARIPKGVLLIGPPGTGKTLIAKAVAGEAERPFFSISGSDFVEMFVGVGASRIRDLFAQAKQSAPCIVFIDEIDAVGRHRGVGMGGGHDEREQTLNQLLVEMDGFETNEGVILVAATNRPDVLDKALLRPGRFDRNVILDLPDIKGRLEILKVHARKIKLDSSVNLMDLARATAGASGADLMNVLNEAALLAARRGRSSVTHSDALEACDKVRYGKERRSLELDEKEKKHTAYHESGHAIVGVVVEKSDPIEKVTIIPRGFSLGATYFIPEKNKMSYWRKELIDELAVCMGGRVAEEMFVGDISSGAQRDISHATSLARSMVCQWGMNASLGPVSYEERGGDQGSAFAPSGGAKNYSEETARQIDTEVRKLLREANQVAQEILENNREKVELMTKVLIEFETLDKEDVLAIMQGSWSGDNKKKKIQGLQEAQLLLPPPPPPPSVRKGSRGPGEIGGMAPQGA